MYLGLFYSWLLMNDILNNQIEIYRAGYVICLVNL